MSNLETEQNASCPSTPRSSSNAVESNKPTEEFKKPCEEHEIEPNEKPSECENTVPQPDRGCGDASVQSRNESGSNPENPHSLTRKFDPNVDSTAETVPKPMECPDFRRTSGATSKVSTHRNPITGFGLDGDGVGGWKPIKPKPYRDDNPVTGETYKTSGDAQTPQTPNKKRIPPGGFSSGLW